MISEISNGRFAIRSPEPAVVILSLSLALLLGASSAPGGPKASELIGYWICNTAEGSVSLIFETEDRLIYDGDPAQYSISGSTIQVMGDYGPTPFPYRLDGNSLAITFPEGVTYTFVKQETGSGGGSSPTAEVDRQIRAILLSSAWKSFSYSGGSSSGFDGSEMMTHSHSVERHGYLRFFPDGTYSRSEKSERSYTGSGAETGLNALVHGASGDGSGGKWEVKYTNLYASEGDGAVGLVSFFIFCNNKKDVNTPSASHPEGELPFYYVEGTNQCRCGGSPILLIEGNEYSLYTPE